MMEHNKSFLRILLVISCLLMVGSQNLKAWSSDRITPLTRVSMLTASPGEELYSVFGHSALRVHDPVTMLDEVYNYGTFDFNTPNFYLKFIRGQLLYQLTVTTFETFLAEYHYEGRAVYEQMLALEPGEVQSLYQFLQVNRMPENRDYLYDFFFDNCATRIRDVIDAHVEVEWDPDPFPGPPRSFRDMLQPYVAGTPWAAFGIDLALGLPADEITDPWDYMFLPDEMFVAFAQARRADGRPLVESFLQVLPETIQHGDPSFMNPARIMWILFLLGVLSLFNKRISKGFDLVYFSLLGVGGLVVFFLWFFSDHAATKNNLVLLWMLPTHLYFIFRAYSAGRYRKMAALYFKAVFVLNLAFLFLWWVLPQGFHPAFFPLILTAALKASFIGFMPEGLPALRRTKPGLKRNK